ncbi:D-ribitol-5-phosphate cytidylyltransferase [Acipenser oxyrinchus oxyrinchus]|uniref:D-ribitol-5-phosphate cytidylyltransferase n=1 Tax=Acipenser oxyrinchus oxyrinchus TaxID=40147 RepID=A0AAD8GEV9_ACIOX|nr:D-ribitol-5-phosphate cytidylyltransferase [Acipenser oxyrinchus oxyrinchus]
METDRKCPHRAINPATRIRTDPALNCSCTGSRMVGFPVAVVLPAGGSGERMGLSTPKQFCDFLDRPLISFTIEAFERINWIQNIVVVVAKECIDLMKTIIHKYSHKRITLVIGGQTRHRSIFNGLKVFTDSQVYDSKLTKPEVIIIHDAVRPFVEEDLLLKIATAAKDHGAAGATRPLVSTVIATTSEGCLDSSLERAKYRASEMPQAFLFDTIYQAYQQCSDCDFEYGTECLQLVLQYCGSKAKLIEGPPTLWKVKFKVFLTSAELSKCSVSESLSQKACVITGVQQDAVQLAHCLEKTLLTQLMVEVISTPVGEEVSCIQNISSKEYRNIIYVIVNDTDLQEIKQLVESIGNTSLPILYPVVVIMVHLNKSESMPFSNNMDELGAIRLLAKEAKQKNILVYGLLVNYPKDTEKWNDAVANVCLIAGTLIKDRNAVLAGQLFVA